MAIARLMLTVMSPRRLSQFHLCSYLCHRPFDHDAYALFSGAEAMPSKFGDLIAIFTE